MASYVKYIGNGNFFQGVACVDMTKDEWLQIPEGVRNALLEQKIFELCEAESAGQPEFREAESADQPEENN